MMAEPPAGAGLKRTVTAIRRTEPVGTNSTNDKTTAFVSGMTEPAETAARSSYDNTSASRIRSPATVDVPRAPLNMDSATEERGAIDPISRQILARTYSQHRVPGAHHAPSSSQAVASATDEPVQQLNRQSTSLTEADSLRRTESLLSNKGTKEKKKGFFSRILGAKNKDDVVDPSDHASEFMDNREPGNSAEVFSRPVGYEFTPHHPAPPRYIRVKAQNRRKRDLDRLFLAQILSEGAPRSRKTSNEIDAKIHGINERPFTPPPNSTKTKNNAIWAAEVSRDGQYYAAGGQDKKLKVWRIISSKQDRETPDDESGHAVHLNAPVFKQELVREYEGHASAILDLSWSKNNFLLSSSMDKTVRLYHVSRPECLCAFKHSDFVTSISFHPRDDRFFLAGSLDSKIRLWSIPDKNVAYWTPVQDMVTAVAFTPDGKTAIAGTLSGMCILYDTEGLKAHSQIHVRSNRGKNSKGSKITGIETTQVARHTGPPDVKVLITSNDSRIRLYNLRDRSLEVKFRGNENDTSQIRASFSDDGKFVICGSEDRRVYVWPTGPVERTDSDKRPVEVFEAHTATVTTALLLPAKSRKLLARSGDPIFDLCNPPPVRLLSRTDSIISSRAPTDSGDSTAHRGANLDSPPTEESPQHAARHVHNGGLILVTGDYTGEVKVFRQDCAYQKRKEGSWDTASFSRKMLGRSGSVATRHSGRSSTNRKSMTFGESKSPANRESIIYWQNSVAQAKGSSATTSTSEVPLGENHRASLQQERDRSSSPVGSTKRGWTNRFSLRHGSTPLANSTRPSTDESQRLQTPQDKQRPSETTITGSNNSPNYYSATESVHRNSVNHNGRHNEVHPMSQPVPNISLTAASPSVSSPPVRSPSSGEDPDDNGLFLVGEQSFMAYDKDNWLRMASTQPRTPAPEGVGGRRGLLDRGTSYVSQLSDEQPSTRTSSISANTNDSEHRNGQQQAQQGGGLRISGVSDGEKSESEELKCKKCGSEAFSRVKHNLGKGLKCRRCGEVVPD